MFLLLAASLALAYVVVEGLAKSREAGLPLLLLAAGLALAGWVRNLGDGRVEWEAEGPREAVEALVTWSWKGPSFARVDAVEVEWRGLMSEAERDREGGKFRVRR